MNLPSVAVLIEALESRAHAGRTSPRATAVLGGLKLVSRKTLAGATLEDAIDQVLWDAVKGVETPHLVTGRGGSWHSQAAIRCYLAVYVRLDVAAALVSEPAIAEASVFPEAAVVDEEKADKTSANRAILRAFDRDCKWGSSTRPHDPSVRATMAAALSLSSPRSIDNKFARLAPALLAGELMRHEAMLHLPSPEGIAAILRKSEESLEACGLLASYCATMNVQDRVDPLVKLLEAPLDGYTEPIKEFSFVIAQLDHTAHSLHGVMGFEDTTVSENEAYVKRQLLALKERGIDIERIFLYDDKNKAPARELAKDQIHRAAGAIADGGGCGDYKAYLVARSVAHKVFTKEGEIDEKFLSMVIVDRGHSTQRVVTQRFGPPHEYTSSAYPPNVEQASKYFDVLRNLAEPVQAHRRPPGR
jgi:hypothetical protein